MIEYSWNILTKKKIDTAQLSDFVVEVYWTKTGTENGKTAVFSGVTSFPLHSDTENFIPYEELTDETVLSWIKNIVVGDYEHFVNTKIEDKLIGQ